jgi:hypothetical protein
VGHAHALVLGIPYLQPSPKSVPATSPGSVYWQRSSAASRGWQEGAPWVAEPTTKPDDRLHWLDRVDARRGAPLQMHLEFVNVLCKSLRGKKLHDEGLDGWPIHRMRHTMASRLAKVGPTTTPSWPLVAGLPSARLLGVPLSIQRIRGEVTRRRCRGSQSPQSFPRRPWPSASSSTWNGLKRLLDAAF